MESAGGGDNPPFGESFLERIVGVHWPKKEEGGGIAIAEPEQALVVFDSESGSSVALDTGDSFGGTISGASGRLGLGVLSTRFTVLSSGVVVYGKPINGDACFINCDGNAVMRGTHSDVGTINWDSVYSVGNSKRFGLSFGGGAFFLLTEDEDTNVLCTVSTDGVHFSGGSNPFANVPENDNIRGRSPGSVAGGTDIFVATGQVNSVPNAFLEDNSIVSGDSAMMWAASSTGAAWASGYSPDELTDPGQLSGGTSLGSTDAMATVAYGNGVFVSVATKRTNFFWFSSGIPSTTHYTTRPTAAAAVSSSGSSWSTVALPGAVQANYNVGGANSASESNAVAFIKTGEIKSDVAGVPPIPTGYFVMTANGGSSPPGPIYSDNGCWRGDGGSWSRVMSGTTTFGHVSAIAKDLDKTTIVRI